MQIEQLNMSPPVDSLGRRTLAPVAQTLFRKAEVDDRF